MLELLDEEGLFITESHYWLSLLETLQYDTIYHEHLRYYSLTSLRNLLTMHGLEVVHAKRIPTHGGSIRAYAARRGRYPVRPTVAPLLETEGRELDAAALDRFRRGVVGSKLGLHALLRGLKAGGKRVYGIGAPSRASTLVNYVGLDDGIVDCVLEIKDSYKVGKYMPGTLIPVLDEERLFADQPDYALMLSVAHRGRAHAKAAAARLPRGFSSCRFSGAVASSRTASGGRCGMGRFVRPRSRLR